MACLIPQVVIKVTPKRAAHRGRLEALLPYALVLLTMTMSQIQRRRAPLRLSHSPDEMRLRFCVACAYRERCDEFSRNMV